jgi:hypothetical protein
MKYVRVCYALSCLLALSACSSRSPSQPYPFKNNKRPVAPAPATPTPVPVATPAAPEPAPPPAPVVVTPPPAPEPVVAPTPEPTPPVAVPASVAAEPASALSATRSGSVVKLSWTLPSMEEGYRSIEIMRNTSSSAQGRGRIRAVRATVTGIEDTVPEASDRYWYWLKLTTANAVVINVGPVEALAAQ